MAVVLFSHLTRFPAKHVLASAGSLWECGHCVIRLIIAALLWTRRIHIPQPVKRFLTFHFSPCRRPILLWEIQIVSTSKSCQLLRSPHLERILIEMHELGTIEEGPSGSKRVTIDSERVSCNCRGGSGCGTAVWPDHNAGAVRGALHDRVPHRSLRGGGGLGHSRTVPVAADHGVDKCGRPSWFWSPGGCSQLVLAKRWAEGCHGREISAILTHATVRGERKTPNALSLPPRTSTGWRKTCLFVTANEARIYLAISFYAELCKLRVHCILSFLSFPATREEWNQTPHYAMSSTSLSYFYFGYGCMYNVRWQDDNELLFDAEWAVTFARNHW